MLSTVAGAVAVSDQGRCWSVGRPFAVDGASRGTVLHVWADRARRCATRRRPGHGRRFTAASIAGPLVALLGHIAGGGSLPISCGGTLAVLAIGLLTTVLAVQGAHRSRGPWAALAALAAGQVSIEVLLSLSSGRAPTSPLSIAPVHVAATLALAALLLGSERTMSHIVELLDRWLPRWWSSTVPPGVTLWVPHARAMAPSGGLLGGRQPRAPRGPPVRA